MTNINLKIFIFLIFTFFFSCKSQNLKGKIVFEAQIENIKIKNVEGELFFNDKQSLYIIKSIDQNTKVNRETDGSIVYPSNSIDSIANKKRFIIFDSKSRNFYGNIINDNIENLIIDSPKFNWIFANETKTILGYKCQKAICSIYDNDYVAWFTQEIPASYGPLKFNGLDGMILELKCDKTKLHLLAVNIQLDVHQANKEILSYTSKYDFSKSVTRSEYNTVLENQIKMLEDKLNLNITDEKYKTKFKNLNCDDCNK
ncbi:GLPGLI family protein [Frigoriflavimonas asaccharolytica]|uniref:GLPGLI family protein n=1 Tax=Frigoriflavimonas asaccharolytica TaxID=2735899 RepID=A0A8J8G8C9_9FLAO|nr:GLPGLI family protein [Frigoriflavimonas asaccharolytica]NRS93189.1 GLPGLI family protein [Frigoriflavimonas asaccharolytica]